VTERNSADLFGTTTASAVLSPYGHYRYELRRTWADGPVCGWIMCNPSTADAHVDDPTIRRCVRFARRWGYAGIVVRNVYALRSTDPTRLHAHPDPFGPSNTEHLARAVDDPITVCAWGNHAAQWGERLLDALAHTGAPVHFLARNTQGVPKHPLYLPGHLVPIPFEASATGTEPEGSAA
jgi:hypothetical protein